MDADRCARLLVDGLVKPVSATEASWRVARLGEHWVKACKVVPYDDGGGLHGGHIAYVWSSATATFVVSVHGYGNEPRARTMMAALVGEPSGPPEAG